MVQLAQALAQSSIHSVCTRPGALGAGNPWRLRPLRLLADECQGRPRMPRTNVERMWMVDRMGKWGKLRGHDSVVKLEVSMNLR